METIYRLSLADAKRIAHAAETEARYDKLDVAINKANTAVFFRSPTKALEKRIADGRTGYLSIQHMLPVEGGLPLIHQGQVVGAIGISGSNSEVDGKIAQAGAKVL